ncbi:MAG: pyridoxal phosphate-dependent aminotransferase [Acetobacter sp.]
MAGNAPGATVSASVSAAPASGPVSAPTAGCVPGAVSGAVSGPCFENARTAGIRLSAAMAASMRATALRAQGRTVFDLSLGEPDFNTPAPIVQAALEAMQGGLTHYTGPSGLAVLKDAIIRKFARENGLTYTADEIAVGVGAKQILFDLFMGSLNPGDTVLIPAPFWLSYRDMVEYNGGQAVLLPCGAESNFKLAPERLAAAMTPQTRWLMLNNPSNPSGAVYTQAELQALGAVLERHPQVCIMSDEIYEHIRFDGVEVCSFPKACPALKDRTLVVNGVSKAYAMTGWRLGYAAGPAGLIRTLNKLESQTTTCPSSISQVAAAAALDGPQDFLVEAQAAYTRRRALVLDGLAGTELRVVPPDGAFYIFPECSAYLGRYTPDGRLIGDDIALADYLLDEGGVAVVPGQAFGVGNYLRLSFATSEENLRTALAAMVACLSTLKKG